MKNLKNYETKFALSNKYAYVIIWVLIGFTLPIVSSILYLTISGSHRDFDFGVRLRFIIVLLLFYLGLFLVFRFFKPLKITNPRHDDDFIKSNIFIFLLSLGSAFGLLFGYFPDSLGLEVLFFVIPLLFISYSVNKWNKFPSNK